MIKKNGFLPSDLSPWWVLLHKYSKPKDAFNLNCPSERQVTPLRFSVYKHIMYTIIMVFFSLFYNIYNDSAGYRCTLARTVYIENIFRFAMRYHLHI